MALVLGSLLAKRMSIDMLINWLKSEDSKPLDCLNGAELSRSEFISFFLNYLRDQASAVLYECTSATSTPSKALVAKKQLSTEPSDHCDKPLLATPCETFGPTSAESVRTSSNVDCVVASSHHSDSLSRSAFAGHGKKRGIGIGLTDFSPIPSELAATDCRYQALQCRLDSHSTPKPRAQRATNLGDFISPPGDSFGRALFSDNSSSHKKQRGKVKASFSRQEMSRQEKVKKADSNVFTLESEDDFPGMSSSLSRGPKAEAPSRRITPTLVSLPQCRSDEQDLTSRVTHCMESSSHSQKNNSRRITPVSVSSADQNDVFMRVPIVPAPAHAMPRSVWAHPRNLKNQSLSSPVVKSPGINAMESGTNDEENLCVNSKSRQYCQTEVTKVAMTPQKVSLSRATTPQKTSLSRLTSCEIVSANPASATFVDELELLADLYSQCIAESLVPNIVVELYFITQLLCVRSSPAQDQSLDCFRRDTNYFFSVHNCVLFASKALSRLQNLFLLLDRQTLHLMAGNQRISDFVPEIKDTFSRTAACLVQTNPVRSLPLLGGVAFQADTDNRSNFPSERSFQLFKKQRDLFYELLREWEDKHMDPGWTVKICQTDRIRCVVHYAGTDLSNHLHLVRLFILQLIQMCRADGSKLIADGDDAVEQLELKNLNPDKLKRLQERLITPSSVGGVCPNPSFPGSQEFFRDFIICAASNVFNHHLCDGIVAKIVELSDSQKFVCSDSECDDGSVSYDARSELIHNLVSLRILGKFLGFVTFLPYQSIEPPVESVSLLSVKARNKTSPLFDVCRQLKLSIQQRQLVACVAWLTDYLSMMDSLTTHLEYYQQLLVFLVFIYRFCCFLLFRQNSHAILLVASLIGWFFELGVFPDSLFFKEHGIEASDVKFWHSHLETIDPAGLIDQRALYACCPHLGEIRNVLLDFEIGGRNQRGLIRKITPVTALASPLTPARAAAEPNEAQLQMSLEESFFRLHSSSLRRTVEFVAERMASNWIKKFQMEKLTALLAEGREWSKKLANDVSSSQAAAVVLPENVLVQLDEYVVNLSRKVAENSKSEYHSYFQLKSVHLLSLLLSDEMPQRVIGTASFIACRVASNKVSTWLASNINTGYFSKQLKSECEKQFRVRSLATISDNVSSVSDTSVPQTDVKRDSTCQVHDRSLPSPSDLMVKLKDLLRRLLLRNGDLSEEAIMTLVGLASNVLVARQDLLPGGIGAIARLISDVAVYTITCRPDLWTDDVQCCLIDLWQTDLSLVIPVKKIIGCRIVSCLEQSPDPETSLVKLTSLIGALICSSILSLSDLRSGFISITRREEYVKSESRIQLERYLQNVLECSPLVDSTRRCTETVRTVQDSLNENSVCVNGDFQKAKLLGDNLQTDDQKINSGQDVLENSKCSTNGEGSFGFCGDLLPAINQLSVNRTQSQS